MTQAELSADLHDGRPVIMGILNTTPDSFSDGGRFEVVDVAIEHARQMIAAGARIIDVGGESTRPGAKPVGIDEELERVIPVIETLAANSDALISIDTSKPEVMKAGIEAGAAMVNDVNALRADGALEVCAEGGVYVCLMHMQGRPGTMQRDPVYEDVVTEVKEFLLQRAAACIQAGIPPDRIILDPGFGFGKTLDHNLALLDELNSISELEFPVLVGISRKSMLGQITGREVDQRVAAGLATTVLAREHGARLFRVHDVAQTRDALLVCEAIRNRDTEV